MTKTRPHSLEEKNYHFLVLFHATRSAHALAPVSFIMFSIYSNKRKHQLRYIPL